MTIGASLGAGMDSRGLDALRQEAARNPQAATRQAAVQFESLFMQMVLKSMRDATFKADQASSSMSQDTFASMMDSQLARQFAGRPGGLADVLERQLTQHMRNLPPLSAQNQAAAAAAAAAGPSAGALRAAPAASGTAAAATVPGSAAPSAQASFLQRLLPHAQQAQRQTGVPASFILGQAALESGWGRGEIRNADGSPSYNLFGIKADASWKGAVAQASTTEYEGGVPVRQTASFRSYSSYAEAFADYANLLANSPRYSAVVRGSSSAEAFAGGMQRAGYATDPQYATKLARTINHALAVQRAQS